jgi:tRNA modification GTPase
LLRESRSIVTHLPGTTRDTIEEVVNIKGVPVVLVDTAGITLTDHPVEKEGIRRSHFSIQKSDLVIFVLDYGRKINKNDLELIRSIKDKQNMIIVINKKDLKKNIDIPEVKKCLPKRPLLYVSAANQRGIDKLEDTMRDVVFEGKSPSADFTGVSNDRHLSLLRSALNDLNEAINAFGRKIPQDCIAVYVRSSIEAFGEITGQNITEEALDKIFSEFCIGK